MDILSMCSTEETFLKRVFLLRCSELRATPRVDAVSRDDQQGEPSPPLGGKATQGELSERPDLPLCKGRFSRGG